jgi:hypothetical protein
LETISIIEIFILLTIAAVCYDAYRLYSFDLPHYKQGITLATGTTPLAGRDEFPSNYKMVYRSQETAYKFVGPTSMVYRYDYESGNIKNLIALKGVGELKDGEIILTSRFGVITPAAILVLLCANLILLGRVPSAQEIFGSIVVLTLVTAYFLYCRMFAVKLPSIIADQITENLKPLS